jgi:hypothetical protein
MQYTNQVRHIHSRRHHTGQPGALSALLHVQACAPALATPPCADYCDAAIQPCAQPSSPPLLLFSHLTMKRSCPYWTLAHLSLVLTFCVSRLHLQHLQSTSRIYYLDPRILTQAMLQMMGLCIIRILPRSLCVCVLPGVTFTLIFIFRPSLSLVSKSLSINYYY